ncbi:MAG: GtrA family protein [Deltaproteobacteria bacterium]|nr:MAG: GtrA family protein [Deltaproteobacteria bacterium]
MIRALWDRVPPERQRFLRFAVVGVSGVAVNLGVMALARAAFADLAPDPREFIASALGIIVSIFTNFILNDVWTWGDRRKGSRRRDFALRMFAYYVGAGIAAGLQFGTFALLYGAFALNPYLAQLTGIALGMVVNYVINNRVVFRDKKEQSQP